MTFMNIFLLVCFLPIPIILYAMLRSDAKPRKNIILGVTLPYDARQDERVTVLCKSFKRNLGILTMIITAAVGVVFFMHYDSVILTYYLTWLVFAICLPYAVYIRSHLDLKKLKTENGWFTSGQDGAVVDIRAAAEPMPRARFVWFLIPMLISLIPIAFVLWEGDYYRLIIYGVILLLIVMYWGIYHVLDRQRKDVVDENTPLTIALTRVRRYNWSKCWVGMAYVTAAYSIGCYLAESSVDNFLVVNGLFVAAVFFLALRTEFVARLAQHKLTQESGRGVFVDEDSHWILGMIYYNPNDSHFMIQNRVGIGTTVNVAKPAGKGLMIFSALLVLLMPLLGIWMIAEETTPIGINVTPAAIIARHNGTTYEIPLGSISSVSIIPETPKMRKNYGTNFSRLYKGTFTLDEIGQCKIMLDPGTPPLIRIDTDDTTYVIGLNQSELAVEKYTEIQELLQSSSKAVSNKEIPGMIQAWIQLLIDGEYEAAMAPDAPLNPNMRAAIEQYGGGEGYMEAAIQQTGKWLSAGAFIYYMDQGDYSVFQADFMCENGSYTLLVPVDADNRIAGMQFQPGAEDPIAMPAGYTETPVTVDAGEGFPLEGRLVMPDSAAGKVPAVLLIQGSGATDYDEIVGVNRVFGKLAHGLAERGIASLRYTKRNYAYPEIMSAKDYTVGDEYVRDVLAAVEMLRAREGVGEVYILGHSQGGMLAPMFADAGADVDGMILFAGTPRNFLDIFETQQADLLNAYEAAGMQEAIDEYKPMQDAWRAEAAKLKTATKDEAMEMETVFQMGAYYLYDLLSYDPIGLIKSQKLPTLIMQGANDWQVKADTDYSIYSAELGGESYVEMRLYAGLSHLFTPSAAQDILTAVSEYNAVMEIPSEVFDDIADWISQITE